MLRPIALALIACAALGACSQPTPLGAFIAADATSIMVLHRGIADLVVSGATGRDCSVVRLDRGQTYCRPLEPPPPAPPYCTRSLGTVDCWASPVLPTNPGRGVADGPRTLNEVQEADRLRPWPGLFSGLFY